MNEKCTLYLVVPCYNEQEVLTETNRQLLEKMTSLMERGVIHEKSRILYVNDGSKDQTWILIRKFHGENVICSGLTLSRNRGHQNAVLAGLMYAKEHCDVVITLDADLQDDINAMDEMIEQYKQGCEIVYGVGVPCTIDNVLSPPNIYRTPVPSSGIRNRSPDGETTYNSKRST